MLNVSCARTTFIAGWLLKASRIDITERSVVAQVSVSAPGRHSSRFSHIVRGGTVIGLMAAAGGSVIFQLAGWTYSPIPQTIIAVLGVLAGTVIGAREPV